MIEVRMLGFERETVAVFNREQISTTILRPMPMNIRAVALAEEPPDPLYCTVRYETYEFERYLDCLDGGPIAIFGRVA